MNQRQWETVGDVSINAFALFCLIFVVLYGIFSPWYRTQMGRNIMTLMASLAAVAGYSIYANYLSRKGNPEAYDAAVEAAKAVHYPLGFWQIRAFLFAALAIAVGWRIVLYIKAQLNTRKRVLEERKKNGKQGGLREQGPVQRG